MNISLKHFTVKNRWLFSLLSVAIYLSGCSSIGKGVAEALLEKTESEDTRMCQIWGSPFPGISASLDKTKGKTKVLMVHGVGDHVPGYTTQFLEKLAKQLNLTARSEIDKNIELDAPLFPGKDIGNLRVTHLLNEETHKELTFYELTWSVITRSEKDLLTYDTSGDYDFRRARINSIMKKFSNDVSPDPIIYLGQSREPILASFAQSFCWMATRDWEDLPDSGRHTCMGLNDSAIGHIANDDYVIISHSLGSRITIDGMQRIADILANQQKYATATMKVAATEKSIAALQNKHILLVMLSNQLPMLQMGRALPEITGQYANYCDPKGNRYNKRMVRETSILAFTDPNDLLSYGIPPGFIEKYLDSRLCSRITNVNINVAKVMDAFGISDLANPMEAHVGYDQDDRVIALIANGIGHEKTSPLVKKRCEFIKTVK
ncbi:MAG: hypothetical protein ACR65R_14535 [Methylomicrobium sp.]